MTRGCLAMLVLTVALGASVRRASAEPTTDDATAEALFDEAVALRNAGDRAGACVKFRRSYKLSPARGTLLNIAECFEAEGKLASAWATYSTLADKAEAADDRERLRIARDKRSELAPRLAHVTIVIAKAPDDLEVRRDETALPVDVLDEPVPVDAGSHTITARAPGYETWTTTVDVTDGHEQRVEIPALVPLPPPPPAPPAPIASVSAVRVQTLRHRHPRRTAGMITTGAGALGVTVGLGLGFMAWRRDGEADRNCDDDLVCNRRGIAQLDDAKVYARDADLLMSAGAVVAAVGLALWWTAPADTLEKRDLTIAPMAGAGTLGLALGGPL